MIPEYLIREWTKDRPQVPRFNMIGVQAAGAATSLTMDHVIDKNYDCIIQAMCCETTAGGAQTVTSIQFRIVDKQGNFNRIMSFVATTPRVQETLNWQGAELYIPQGYIVRCVCFYSAGAISNSASFSLSSLFVPETNFLK